MTGGGYRFVPYQAGQRAACLALFDANCPAFFAPAERVDYEAFLDRAGTAAAGVVAPYVVCMAGECVVRAFGTADERILGRRRLTWILLAPQTQGGGIGRAMVAEATAIARAAGAHRLDVAASHHSAPFFTRLGARELWRIDHGWGTDMHRVDMELPL